MPQPPIELGYIQAHDPCVYLLLRSVAVAAGPRILAVLDENADLDDYAALLPFAAVNWLTNRWDIWRDLDRDSASFADFAAEELTPGSIDAVLFRVAKETAVVHRVVNLAGRLLRPQGTLHLAGRRREGAKTYAARAADAFGGTVSTRTTVAGARCVVLQRGDEAPALLPDSDYERLREITRLNGQPLFSKPGCFGWDRIDPGSKLLAGCLPDLTGATVLDLGCGYGYLTAVADGRGATQVVATDNNAAAIIACRHNVAARGIPGTVVPGDAGDTVRGRFDVAVCNPPFHRGFRRDETTSRRFVDRLAALLKPGGQAWVVANVRMPFRDLLGTCFASVETVRETGGYQVLRAGTEAR